MQTWLEDRSLGGKLEVSKRRSVPAVSTRGFSLQWTAVQGEHSYGVKLFEVLGGQELEVDSREGEVSVASKNQLFAVVMRAFPTELEGGGTVYLTVKVRNFDAGALSLSGFVEDESGAIIKRIDGFEGRIPANGVKNITFGYTVYGVGAHAFRVFLDNYDGEPNGKGEEHWAEVTMEVKPVNGRELKQVGFECDDPEFNWNGIEYKAPIVCRASVYNPSKNNVEISIVNVKTWTIDNQALENSLGHTWEVEYPNVIHGSETATIIFKNTARTGLLALEKDLFGSYISVSLRYIISPQNGDDIAFTGTDTINIRQDNKDVIVDVGTNLVLIGADVKAGITIAKLAKNGEVIKALKNAWPYGVSFFRWGWSQINN
ncbi:hypothetical protein [Palaeococcus ferrophilus]|uniref:hypothetical protein n=1 Tax=Palaeococcus ferrophilus TaxID=83868 RepID=UPI00064FDFA4|nr:hypothetical protein [Palaeococcus ferrophilus]